MSATTPEEMRVSAALFRNHALSDLDSALRLEREAARVEREKRPAAATDDEELRAARALVRRIAADMVVRWVINGTLTSETENRAANRAATELARAMWSEAAEID